ncbi:MAG: endo-1,4-beta-xylanase [Bacteroidota bacterium]
MRSNRMIVISLVLIGVLISCQTTNKIQKENPSLYRLTQNVRPDFLMGSFSNGLNFKRKEKEQYSDFFTHNFNILTVGIYMGRTQSKSNKIEFGKMDSLIDYATTNNMKVYLHPLIGGWNYTAKWVNNGNYTAEELHEIMRERITGILTRYKGKIDYVDVVNESLTGNGIKEDGSIHWQYKNHKGEKHVWMQTMGMYKGKKHDFPQYLVDAFRISREVADPNVKLILNEWGAETTKSFRGEVFFQIVKNLREEGIPVDGAGMQLHCKLRDGTFYDWTGKTVFDFDAFDEMLSKYEKEGIEVHITEFDIHLKDKPTQEDFELQGKYYAKVLRHVLKSPNVKSFKTWGFTDAHSWKANGENGYPLMLDENLTPKPAYQEMVDMLNEFN